MLLGLWLWEIGLGSRCLRSHRRLVSLTNETVRWEGDWFIMIGDGVLVWMVLSLLEELWGRE